MQNARLDETQAGIKIAWRNISSLGYADDTMLMTEREEELKRFLMRWKKEWNSWLKIQDTKIMASDPITSWQVEAETVADFIFLGSKILQMGTAAMELKDACSLEEKLWQT